MLITVTISPNTPKSTFTEDSVRKEVVTYANKVAKQLDPNTKIQPNDVKCKEGISRSKRCFLITAQLEKSLFPMFTSETLRKAVQKPVLFSPRDIDFIESNVSIPPRRDNPNPATSSKSAAPRPTFTCVLRSVPSEITDKDILTDIRQQFPEVTNAKRIIARSNDKPTRLIRIFSTSQETVTNILRTGAEIQGNVYDAEASNPPPLIRLRCAHCLSFDHLKGQCDKISTPAVCPKCSEVSHPNVPCKSKSTTTCPSCQGNHGAWKCPKALDVPVGAPRLNIRLPEDGPKATSQVSEDHTKPLLQDQPITVHQLMSAMALVADLDSSAPRKVRFQALSHWSRTTLGIQATFLFQSNFLAGIHYQTAETTTPQQPRATHRSRSRERRRATSSKTGGQ